MKIFAIADLHLSGNPPTKPMDIFGSQWQGHWQKIQENWRLHITDEDVVLLAGDLSWGMRWDEAYVDLAEIIALPGRKIIVRGNHDYWWQTVSKMSQATEGKLVFLQNSFTAVSDWAVCGSRGWSLPGDTGFNVEDQAIYSREVGRMRLSLQAAQQAGFRQLIAMLHYPPTDALKKTTGFTELFAEFNVQVCVYGHLHGEAAKAGPTGLVNTTFLQLVACDATNFTLRQILDDDGRICD